MTNILEVENLSKSFGGIKQITIFPLKLVLEKSLAL